MIDGVLESDGITHRRERPRKYVFPAVYSYRYFQLDELNFSCFSITTLREIPSIFFYNLLTTTRRERVYVGIPGSLRSASLYRCFCICHLYSPSFSRFFVFSLSGTIFPYIFMYSSNHIVEYFCSLARCASRQS